MYRSSSQAQATAQYKTSQVASNAAADWAAKKKEKLEKAAAIRSERKHAMHARDADKAAIVQEREAKLRREQGIEEERRQPPRQEPEEPEIPEFLRGYKDGGPGGGWNDGIDVAP